jgi:hypothetical protein
LLMQVSLTQLSHPDANSADDNGNKLWPGYGNSGMY